MNYTLRLFAPYLTVAERQLVINHVIRSLEVEPEALNLQIGCPEWQGSFPSGGQRRRINLAMTSAIYEAQKYLSILEDDVPCKAVYDKLATLVVRSESVEEKRELCRVFKLYLHGKNKAFQNEFEGLVANNDKMLSAIYGTIDF